MRWYLGPLLLTSHITVTTFRSCTLYFMIIPEAIALAITLFMKFPNSTKKVAKEQIKEGL